MIEQAPGPLGSPQLPQGAGLSGRASSPPFPTANTESCFSSRVPSQEGHCGVSSDLITSVSKSLSQFRQRYSKIGMTHNDSTRAALRLKS